MIEAGRLKFFVKTVNSAVTVNGLFVAEQIVGRAQVQKTGLLGTARRLRKVLEI